MKKFLPFIFPAAALLLVIILAFRWYGLRNRPVPARPEFTEGVQIENLSQAELDRIMRGVSDLKKLELVPEPDQTEIMGEVRYEETEGKVAFTVVADLPLLEKGQYQVWLKDTESDATRKAFVLEYMKGGYTGSASLSSQALPFQIIVSREMTDDNQMETVVMKATLQGEKTESQATESAKQAD